VSHERPSRPGRAIEDAGISREKATRIASVIFDAMQQSVATKADVQASEALVRSEMFGLRAETSAGDAAIRADMHAGFARQEVAIERLRSSAGEMESRLLMRLGGIVAAGVAIIVALQHVWPPH
jgi:hypothetical protein